MVAAEKKEKFAAKLTKAVDEHGFTQTELAQLMGVSRQAVSGWMSGHYLPDEPHLIDLAEILGVSPKWLIRDLNVVLRRKD